MFNLHLVRTCFVVSLFLLLVCKTVANFVEVAGLRPPALEFNKYRTVQPVLHHGRTKREISSTRDTSGVHHSEVTIKVSIDSKDFILDLRLNTDLITNNHALRYQKGGKTVIHKPKKEDIDLCQYSGTVRDMPGSWVAVSTCHGVHGVIFDGEEMRYIEPAESGEIHSQHYIYDHSDLNNTPYRCGYEDEGMNNNEFDPLHLKKYQTEKENRSRVNRYKRNADKELRGPYNANKKSRYVELVLVADHHEYRASGYNLRTVHHSLKDLANIINSVYAPLNIFIALVGVVVWTEGDEIQLVQNASVTLTNFLRYRKEVLARDMPNDNAHLLTSQNFDGGVVGKAPKGAMCTHELSGGIASNHSKVIGLVATTIAHEMGHNFNMVHDTGEDCECVDQKCIMSSSSTSYIPTKWSSCSLKSLALQFEKGMDYCLRNKPKPLLDSPTCGNGFVEDGEQCDCGRVADPLAPNPCHLCCEPHTCTLRSNATCGAGACCDMQACRLKPPGTQCRSADRDCDLPEYCSGRSEFCPDDVFKMDTTPCGIGENQAYCVSGSCRSQSEQCQLLWGPTGKSSHDICYTRNNVKGTRYGNCGYMRLHQRYLQCSPRDVMCGTLQCQRLSNQLMFGEALLSTTSYLENNGKVIQCHTAFMDLGPNCVDPGLVPDGAKCGHEMMCLNQRCVFVADMREKIANRENSVCPSNCSGHGICNSKGHCHCAAGFAPPLCAASGAGGSLDSGPATDPAKYLDTHPKGQRNYMVAIYIIFLGVIPLILLISFLLCYYRQNLLVWWRRPRKSLEVTDIRMKIAIIRSRLYTYSFNTKRFIANKFQNDSLNSLGQLGVKCNTTKVESEYHTHEITDKDDTIVKNNTITKTTTNLEIDSLPKIHTNNIQRLSNKSINENDKGDITTGTNDIKIQRPPENSLPIHKINIEDIETVKLKSKAPPAKSRPLPMPDKAQQPKPTVAVVENAILNKPIEKIDKDNNSIAYSSVDVQRPSVKPLPIKKIKNEDMQTVNGTLKSQGPPAKFKLLPKTEAGQRNRPTRDVVENSILNKLNKKIDRDDIPNSAHKIQWPPEKPKLLPKPDRTQQNRHAAAVVESSILKKSMKKIDKDNVPIANSALKVQWPPEKPKRLPKPDTTQQNRPTMFVAKGLKSPTNEIVAKAQNRMHNVGND